MSDTVEGLVNLAAAIVFTLLIVKVIRWRGFLHVHFDNWDILILIIAVGVAVLDSLADAAELLV